jgi:hypothetical protein
MGGGGVTLLAFYIGKRYNQDIFSQAEVSMPSFKDLTGQKFGRLTAISHEIKNGKVHWVCQCDCGNIKTIIARAITRSANPTRSCGCLSKEVLSSQCGENNPHFKHGASANNKRSRTYVVWQNMKDRCYRKKNNRFDRYGGRGIEVCTRWLESFSNFLEDMGERPEKMEIDRIDNNKGYYKENCRWATRTQQINNRENTIFVVLDGERIPLSEACELTGTNYWAAISRVNDGKPFNKERSRKS